MVVPRPSFNSKKQVPNDPISATEEWSLKTPQGSLVTDEGITVDAEEGTISAEGSGVIINTANGICGGPITREGTLTLCHSGVLPGVYSYHDLSIDVYGRVVDVAPGAPASTEGPGVLRISGFPEVALGVDNTSAVTPAGIQSIKSSSVDSTSQTYIATPFAVKRAYDLASVAVPESTFTDKGQLLAATGAGGYIALPVGTEGQILKVCPACPSGITWHTDEIGDDIPCSIFTASGQILASTGANQFLALDSGPDGEVLTACAACSGGLTWEAIAPVNPATPTSLGTVYGLTDSSTLTALGYNALSTNPAGTSNTAVGHRSSELVISGCRNTSIGSIAMVSTTTGDCNVAAGYGSLRSNVSGGCNTALGTFALDLSGGNCNTSIGYLSGNDLTTGCSNIFIGAQSATGVSTGSNNIVIGNTPSLGNPNCNIVFGVSGTNIRLRINENGALSFNGTDYGTSGYILSSSGSTGAPSWVSLGSFLASATPNSEGTVFGCTDIPNGTTSIGHSALAGLSSGVENTAIGNSAMQNLTTGSANTVVGSLAYLTNLTGNGNVAIGNRAMHLSDGGTVSIAIGVNALCENRGTGNIGIGENTLLFNGSTGCSVAVGHNALCANGQPCNTAVGGLAACSNAFGCLVTAVGYGALQSNVYANANTAVGAEALACSAGDPFDNWSWAENTAIGHRAHFGGLGCWNTVIGSRALECNTTGVRQVAIGVCALALAGSTSDNVAVGVHSLANSQGFSNTAIGWQSGFSHVSGGNNVFLGAGSGFDSLCSLVTGSNHVIIGNNFTSTIIQKVASTIGSDVRYKKVHGEVPLALTFVQNLETIKYQWCDSETGEVTDDRYRYGFSAQNVIENEENPEHPIIGSTANPDMFTLSPTDMIPVLVNAIKELSKEVETLKSQINPKGKGGSNG